VPGPSGNEQALESTFERALTAAEWDALVSGVDPAYRFLDGNWFESWSRCYLPRPKMEGPVEYVVTRDAQATPLGTLPFVVVQAPGLRILSLAGYYYPLRSIPMHAGRSHEVGRSMAAALASRRGTTAIRLGPVEEHDPAPLALAEALRAHGWSRLTIDHGPQLMVPLPPTFDEFRAGLGRNLRRNIRKGINRMRREGETTVKAFRNLLAGQWDAVIEEIAAVEAASWLHHGAGEPRFLGDRNQCFWKCVLRDPRAARAAGAWLLYLEGEPVAFTFAIDSGGCRYNFAGQHAEAVDRYGTGWIVDHDLFHDAIDGRGLASVNLGDGWAHYKCRWGAVAGARLLDYVVCPPSIKGRLFHLAMRIRQRLSRRTIPGSDTAPNPATE
jgi:CelD/BcsL family acetyltransferase involved in cellulose biosynthesis